MGKTYDAIDETIAKWIGEQKMYFVSTAPLAGDGHVNCSPKGLDSFRILDPHTVAYLDLAGSGVETVAHVKENGRMVLMFCAFEGPPKIYRLHGKGMVVLPDDPEFPDLAEQFETMPGIRSIIKMDVTRISDSCGFGVPRYTFEEDRDTLIRWAEKKKEAGVADYIRKNNATSLDGLPGI